MSEFRAVAQLDAIAAGQVLSIEIEGARIALCNVDGEICAIQDVCTHDNAPLGTGKLDGCEIECPRHGARFDVRTGEVRCFPAPIPVKTYPVKVEDGTIHVDIGS